MTNFRLPEHWSRSQAMAVCELLGLLQQHLLDHYLDDDNEPDPRQLSLALESIDLAELGDKGAYDSDF